MMNLICLQFWLSELIWFTVSSALFIDCIYGNRNEQSRRGRTSMRRAVRTNQSSIRLSRCLPMASRIKRISLIENIATVWWRHGSRHESTKVPDRPKVWEVSADEVLRTLMRLNKSQRTTTILITTKSLTRKFTVITCEHNSSRVFYVLNEFDSTESHRQMKQAESLRLVSNHNDINSNI